MRFRLRLVGPLDGEAVGTQAPDEVELPFTPRLVTPALLVAVLGKLAAYRKVGPAAVAEDGALVFVLVPEGDQIGDIATVLA